MFLRSHDRLTRCLIAIFFVLATSHTFASFWCEQNCSLSQNMLKVGYDRLNNRTLYACQANLWGSLQIGHTWSGHARCHLPYGGKIYTVDRFSVLKKIEGRWQPYYGFFPNHALILGIGSKRQQLTLCRGYYDKSLIPGKTWQGHKTCDIVLRGKVISLNHYSVFLKK